MRRRRGLSPWGLRARIILGFAVGAAVVAATFAVSTYAFARNYLIDQRQNTVIRQAFVDANLARSQLGTAGAKETDVLAAINPPAASTVLLHRGGRWFSSSLDVGAESVPADLQTAVAQGPAQVKVRSGGLPRLAVGIPLPDVGATLYEITSLAELENTLRALAAGLGAGALVATLAGAALGWRAARLVVQPLDRVAETAVQIASGQLSTRLPPTSDPDLATIVGSFNSMVEALQQRIERDARFAGDVSHELRSPLTTLVGSMDVLGAQREALPPRSRAALDLAAAELSRFRRLLDDLIELARADAGWQVGDGVGERLSLRELLWYTLRDTGRPTDLLAPGEDCPVLADKIALQRAFVNLLDNADRHGRGVVGLGVHRDGDTALVHVDDAGPGVPAEARSRIFERFATVARGRGSTAGTGLGLALVAQTLAAHHGAVWCTDRPGGGARFVVSLPLAGP
ncbi:MAG: ATP-binding protein [Actinomycetota bacterium]